MTRRVDPDDLYRVLRAPDLLDPVLLVHFDGWIDAAGAAHGAVEQVIESTAADPIVEFDTEWLIDHRARRPIVHLVEGVSTGIDWPTIEIAAGRDDADRDVLVLHGAEPDHNWRSFVDAVLGLVERFGVRRVVALGAYPAAVPHTRESRLTITSPVVELARSNEPRATLDVPAGMAAVLEGAASKAGNDALTLWAQVPHYIPSGPYPAATIALLAGLDEAAGLRIGSGTLPDLALGTRNRLDKLIAGEESHGKMLAELEQRWDEFAPGDETLPTSDELAAQVEQFLRDHDDEPDPRPGEEPE